MKEVLVVSDVRPNTPPPTIRMDCGSCDIVLLVLLNHAGCSIVQS